MLKHLGIIYPNGRREILLECNLLSRAGRKPHQDPGSVHWVETKNRNVEDVAKELQEVYNKMAGVFAARRVDIEALRKAIEAES